MRMSAFFRNLVENLDEGESEIALEEEHVYKAAVLLLEFAEHYSHEAAPSVQVAWNRSKAILSTKWLVEEYVDAYRVAIEKHIEDVLSKDPSAVDVSGITMWSCRDPATATRVASLMNGIYDKTDELVGGLPIYLRRGLDEDGDQLIMEYYLPTQMWQIKPSEDKGTTRCSADVRCNPPVLPHLIKEVWQVWDKDAPGAKWKDIAQPAVKVSRVPSPPSADVLLFWEMVRTIFQHVSLMRGPIHTMEELVKVLSKRRDLCVVEEMEEVMSKKDLLLWILSQVHGPLA
jgi:hypothetical protein